MEVFADRDRHALALSPAGRTAAARGDFAGITARFDLRDHFQ
jgi:hypothetical protein